MSDYISSLVMDRTELPFLFCDTEFLPFYSRKTSKFFKHCSSQNRKKLKMNHSHRLLGESLCMAISMFMYEYKKIYYKKFTPHAMSVKQRFIRGEGV